MVINNKREKMTINKREKVLLCCICFLLAEQTEQTSIPKKTTNKRKMQTTHCNVKLKI